MDWYCGRTRKQGHRIQIETGRASVLLRLDNEIDAHSWYQALHRAVQQHRAQLSPSNSSISSPTNVVRTSTETLIKQLGQSPPALENKQQNFKLGRRGEKLQLYRLFITNCEFIHFQEYPSPSEGWPPSCEGREVTRRRWGTSPSDILPASNTLARGNVTSFSEIKIFLIFII